MPERKHYVEFFSPGSFVSESRCKPIDSWDVAAAEAMADTILERYNAKPYGFRFKTRIVAEPVPDGAGGTLEVLPKTVDQSGMHYLGGTLLRYDDLEGDPKMEIARSNMRCNRHPIIIRNNNSWMFHGEFEEGDCIVEGGKVTTRGDDPELVEYRRRKNAEFQAELERDMAKYAAAENVV